MNAKTEAVIDAALAQFPQITGATFGEIEKDGKKIVGLRLKVQQKVSLEALKPHQVLPREFMGHPVDVVQGYAEIQVSSERSTGANPREWSEVLRPGHSIGPENGGGTGTLGFFLRGRKTGLIYGITNHHVLSKKGIQVIHPGPADQRGVKTQIGTTFATSNESIDAAIIVTNPAVKPGDCPVGLDDIPLRGWREVQLGETVMKMGRTTMLTYGKVVGFGKVRLGYDNGMRNIHAIEIRPLRDGNPDNEEISSGGDSGSGWITKNGVIIGLHFAGEGSPEPADEIAYACPIIKVLAWAKVVIGEEVDVNLDSPIFADADSSQESAQEYLDQIITATTKLKGILK